MFDNYAVTVMIGGEPYTLGLFDTAGNKIADVLTDLALKPRRCAENCNPF